MDRRLRTEKKELHQFKPRFHITELFKCTAYAMPSNLTADPLNLYCPGQRATLPVTAASTKKQNPLKLQTLRPSEIIMLSKVCFPNLP